MQVPRRYRDNHCYTAPSHCVSHPITSPHVKQPRAYLPSLQENLTSQIPCYIAGLKVVGEGRRKCNIIGHDIVLSINILPGKVCDWYFEQIPSHSFNKVPLACHSAVFKSNSSCQSNCCMLLTYGHNCLFQVCSSKRLYV